MKQITLARGGFEQYAKTTKRATFLAEMNQVIPWGELCALIEPHYPKAGGRGRPPWAWSGCCASISCSTGST